MFLHFCINTYIRICRISHFCDLWQLLLRTTMLLVSFIWTLHTKTALARPIHTSHHVFVESLQLEYRVLHKKWMLCETWPLRRCVCERKLFVLYLSIHIYILSYNDDAYWFVASNSSLLERCRWWKIDPDNLAYCMM